MRTHFSTLLCLAILVVTCGFAKEKGGRTAQGITGLPLLTNLNINNFTSFYRADGQGNFDVSGHAGGRFPRKTATCIYTDGFVWGGKTYLDPGHTLPSNQLIRVGGQTYNQGTRQGWVMGSGAGAVPVAPTDPRARIYRIRRDYFTMSTAELRSDAAILNLIPESESYANADAAGSESVRTRLDAVAGRSWRAVHRSKRNTGIPDAACVRSEFHR